MRAIRVLLVVSAAAALAAAPLWAAGSAESQIPGGVDTIPQSSATVEIEFVGAPGETLNMTGSTVVRRADQAGDTIQTEMLALDLSGTSTIFRAPVKMRTGSQFGTAPVIGAVEDVVVDRQGRFVGGNSHHIISELFFSVFGPRELHFRYEVRPPLRVEARITSLPPNVPPTTPARLGRVDHFKCYTVKARTPFKRRTVSLADQFESEQATVRRPLTLCAPVRKNNARLLLPTAHLKCYEITSESAKPKKDEVDVTVTNQFGRQQLVVLKPRTLCLPTLKKHVTKIVPRPNPPPGPLTKLTDHFKCYDVRAKGPLPEPVVSLNDQFEVERARVLQPLRLCAPVEKNRQRMVDSQTHLTCYAIKDLTRRKKRGERLVVVRNQFGTETLTVLNPQMLCVPSTKKPPCSRYVKQSKAQLVQQNQVVGTINAAIHTPFEKVKDSPCE